MYQIVVNLFSFLLFNLLIPTDVQVWILMLFLTYDL